MAVYRSVEHATSVLLAFVPTCSAIASTGLDISYETIRSWVLKFGPVSRDGYEGVVIGRLTDGIWARSWSGSPASGCASGVPSTTRVRSSTSWFRAGATPNPRGGELLAKRHCGRMTGDPALYLFRPRQLCLAMPCGELRCSWPEIRFLRLSRAAERLHWNNLNADGPALGTGSCGGLGRVNSGHA